MPGCLKNCYLYIERHSIEHLEPDEQIEIEKEIKKFEEGKAYDFTKLKNVIERKCLGEYLKQPNDLPSECKHFWEMPEELSIDSRLAILEGKKNKKWKFITVIVSIVGIAISSFFAYINFSKPSTQELKTENENLKIQINSLQQEIKDNNNRLEKLTNKAKKNME